MKYNQLIILLFITLILNIGYTNRVIAQQFDLLLKGGHIIDPKNEIDAQMDIAVKDGVIAQIADNISEGNAGKVIDASGLYITPGLIDIHSHHFHGTEPNRYLSNSFTALPPDGFTFRVGLTTVVDVGVLDGKISRSLKNR